MKTSSLKTTVVRHSHRCLHHSCQRFISLLFLLLAVRLSAFAEDEPYFYFANVKVNGTTSCTIPQNSVFTRGTASYDSSTKTLTLNNVTVSRDGDGHNCIDNVQCPDLHVVFKGTCLLYAKDDYPVVTRDAKVYTSTYHYDENDTKLTVEGSATFESVNKSALCYQEDDVSKNWEINGPGTLILKSSNSYAMEGNSSIGLIFRNGITATLNGKKGALHNFLFVRCWENSELTLKATNNSSNPIVTQTNLDFYVEDDDSFWDLNGDGYNDTGADIYECKHPVILSPWGATHDNNRSTVLYNGSPIYNQDIVVSNRYDVLVIKQFFPDNKFRSFMASKYPKMYLTQSDTQALTDLNVSGKSISSLEGIQYLKYVKTFNCQNNNLTELELRDNDALTSVNCSYNQLSSLVVVGNPNLTTLNCSNNTPLTSLNCWNNALTSLNINNCPNLDYIVCSYNKFTSLNISNRSKLTTLDCSYNPQMTELNCYNNALTKLDVNGCNQLTKLFCYGNKFTSLNISNRSKLATLDCSNNPLMQSLNCYNNALTSLNISGCDELAYLDCSKNKFETLCVTDFEKLNTLKCENNSLLYSLVCSYNALTTLDISNCDALGELNCSNNSFEKFEVYEYPYLSLLNISDNPMLTQLDCGDNALQELNIYGCTVLNYLICKNNHLASIDVSSNGSLSDLYCSENLLEHIDLSNNPQLTYLACDFNDLKDLDLSKNFLLKEISCVGNSKDFKSLDVSHCTDLKTLNCQGNGLTTLSISGCTKLEMLRCTWNNLSRLILPQSMNLTEVSCYGNRLKGSGMNALIASLPNRKSLSQAGDFIVYYPNTSEGNVCTTQNVNDAWQKNWKTYMNNGGDLVLYDGCEVVIPTDIRTAEATGDADAPRYNLNGQRVGNDYKGVVIQKNRKIVK